MTVLFVGLDERCKTPQETRCPVETWGKRYNVQRFKKLCADIGVEIINAWDAPNTRSYEHYHGRYADKSRKISLGVIGYMGTDEELKNDVLALFDS